MKSSSHTCFSVCFLSNYFNRHQKPFSDSMFELIGSNYSFIETTKERQNKKNKSIDLSDYPPYVVSSEAFYSSQEKYLTWIDNSDVVIIGSAPNDLLIPRLKAKKLIFRYAERPLRKGIELIKYPYRFLSWRLKNRLSNNVYMLCASAFTAGDYSKFLMYRGRCYKWGYFPKTYYHDNVDSLVAHKKTNSLVWVGRFIECKHPEVAIVLAKKLMVAGYSFSLTMVGNGALFEEISRQVKENGLENNVQLLGALHPDDARRQMDSAEIHLFTSDRQEGWGAVLNEAMNSACVPIAHHSIGAAPFLIQNKENGFLYDTIEDLYQKIIFLLNHKDVCAKMGKRAYETIVAEWNEHVAADSFIALSSQLLHGESAPVTKQSGVCSKAPPFPDRKTL